MTPDEALQERLRAEYEEAVDREAKLRKMAARMPRMLYEASERTRTLGERLGLVVYRPERNRNGETRAMVTDALPGAIDDLIKATGLRRDQVNGALRGMRELGLAYRDDDGVWWALEQQEEAA